MPLSQKDIDELKVIYQRRYGESLSDAEAWAMGHRLVRLFTILIRPPAPRDPPVEIRTPSALTDQRKAT